MLVFLIAKAKLESQLEAVRNQEAVIGSQPADIAKRVGIKIDFKGCLHLFLFRIQY